jgi:hypothetical protein
MARFDDELVKILGQKTFKGIRAFVAALRAEGKTTDEIMKAVRKKFAKEIARVEVEIADSHVFGLIEGE